MILLDTNVVSGLMRPQPAPAVLRWVASQDPSSLATSTITLAELAAGLALLPDGGKRRDLQARATQLIRGGFGPRVFAFDAVAAALYGELFALRQRLGRPVVGFDLLIAAIAQANAMPVATRNSADFDGCGLALVNPWAAAPAV